MPQAPKPNSIIDQVAGSGTEFTAMLSISNAFCVEVMLKLTAC